MSKSELMQQLVTMSRNLGNPALDYVILGEGNTAARIDADTFWVKASGAEMRTIAANGFVHVHFDRVLSMLTAGDLSDAQVKVGLEMARVDPTVTARPSVETVLHALALQLEDVKFVGHTHPTDVNTILCSQRAQEAIAGRLFPDEIVTVVLPLSTSHTPIPACLWLEPSAMQSTSISSSTARRPRSSSCRTTA